MVKSIKLYEFAFCKKGCYFDLIRLERIFFLFMKTLSNSITILALLPLLLGGAGCQKSHEVSTSSESAPVALAPQIKSISPLSRQDLNRYFLEYKYSWNTVNHGVPPLIVEKFPDDFYQLAAGKERSKTFFLTLLPMILLVNEEIEFENRIVSEFFNRHDRHEPLSPLEKETVISIAKKYKIKDDPLQNSQARRLLLNRLAPIPPSLALAQAASESAYGTSRFSRLGNNLFGEMVFTSSAEGITPLKREEGAKHRARIFPTLLDSLRAYVLNLNTHPAYKALREIRTEKLTRGEPVKGIDLVEGLTAYSTRKEAYINDIRAIIRANNLPTLTANASLRKLSLDLPASPPQASAEYNYGRALLSQN